MLRVGELVRHALANVFSRGEVEDEALEGAVITVPEVRMTPDLKLANAYVMPLGGERAEEIVEALNRHRKFIRGRIAPELDLKFAPEVRFFVDGRGLFFLHPDENVYAVLCEKGDLLSVPAGVKHWFDTGAEPHLKVIRLFTTPEGWVAQYTGDAIADGLPKMEQFLAECA